MTYKAHLKIPKGISCDLRSCGDYIAEITNWSKNVKSFLLFYQTMSKLLRYH